ncbi:MAG: phosphoribosylaminoimidazolesuccinocarboxamide synthase [Gemmatimonadetes bacterium]|nr:phosphoribosylaminoimidazolesuccinocarboxamide synthase [Gemmatimonadota bacterium]
MALTELPFPLQRRGKVRDVYDLGDALLLVATDRVSAFDVVMPDPIPRKGEVLNLLAAWWFGRISDIVPSHLLSVDPEYILERYPSLAPTETVWARRSTLARKLEPFPVECVVRGYISGSAWKEYREEGTLAGEALPTGLVESAQLGRPIFSPATKAESGHDENITFAEMAAVVGADAAAGLRDASFRIYERGREIAAERDIIIADTKFEFGRDAGGAVFVIDEVLTPDSSRFWPAAEYRAGRGQPSLDKQPLRDYLEGLVGRGEWDRQPPGPDLPDWLVAQTSERYQGVFQRLTGRSLDEVSLSTWGVE